MSRVPYVACFLLSFECGLHFVWQYQDVFLKNLGRHHLPENFRYALIPITNSTLDPSGRLIGLKSLQRMLVKQIHFNSM